MKFKVEFIAHFDGTAMMVEPPVVTPVEMPAAPLLKKWARLVKDAESPIYLFINKWYELLYYCPSRLDADPYLRAVDESGWYSPFPVEYFDMTNIIESAERPTPGPHPKVEEINTTAQPVEKTEENRHDAASPEKSEKEKLREVYYNFYDQLPEPYRSQAKENWDYTCAKDIGIPIDLNRALCKGFSWKHAPQGREYWKNVWNGKFISEAHSSVVIDPLQIKERIEKLEQELLELKKLVQ